MESAADVAIATYNINYTFRRYKFKQKQETFFIFCISLANFVVPSSLFVYIHLTNVIIVIIAAIWKMQSISKKEKKNTFNEFRSRSLAVSSIQFDIWKTIMKLIYSYIHTHTHTSSHLKIYRYTSSFSRARREWKTLSSSIKCEKINIAR